MGNCCPANGADNDNGDSPKPRLLKKGKLGRQVSLTDSMQHPPNRPEVEAKDMSDPNDYEYMNILGAGSYGKVIRVREKKNPAQNYAMKIMDKKQIRNIHGSSHLARVKRERKYLREIGNNHPYLMSMHAEINTRNRVYMLLDLCRGGDLGEFLDKNGPVPELGAKILIAELLLALAKLHAHHLVHRDVRPHNIMVDDEGHIRLADLGIAGRISQTEGSPMQFHTTVIGATGYKAPEMLSEKRGYDYSVDYWSVGIVLYELLFNRHPFRDVQKRARKRFKDVYDIRDYQRDKIDVTGVPLSAEAIDILFKFLEIDVEKRFGWKHKPSAFVEAAQVKIEEEEEEKVKVVPIETKRQISDLVDDKDEEEEEEPLASGVTKSMQNPKIEHRDDKRYDSAPPAPSLVQSIERDASPVISINDDDGKDSEHQSKEEPSPFALKAPSSPIRPRMDSIPLPNEEIRSHPFFAGLDWNKLINREIESPIKEAIRQRLKPLDPEEKPHYPNHLAALEEFNRRDPTILIAEVFA